MVPRALTIATSDSGGGAGIQADLKAFAAAGAHGTSAVVALTAQNTTAVTAVHELPPDFIRAQLEAVFDDIGVDAAKTGMLFSRTIIETVAEFLERHPVPLVVDPVLIASSGAQLLQDDAVETLIGRLFPLATVVTPNLPEAETLTGMAGAPRRDLAERLVELGAAAALVTGGHGETRGRPPLRRARAPRAPGRAVRRRRDARRRLHALGDAGRPARTRPLARGGGTRRRCRRGGRGAARPRRDRRRRGAGRRPRREGSRMTIDPGATLAVIRERKPLVHNITNYVVMNETANAILALGALPVMAHAREEVAEMVGLAGALVLNIGTLSEPWVDAMLIAGKAANERGIPVVLDPVGAGATAYRTETAQRLLDEIDVTVLRGNAGEVATLVGFEAEVRGVESVGAGGDPAELARAAANGLDVVASVTGPVDHVSDGERRRAVANGHPLLASITGTGCMSTAITGCFLAGKDDPFEAAVEALVAFGVAGEDAAVEAKGPGSFHVGALRRARRRSTRRR